MNARYQTMIFLLLFVLGTLVGSFLNVCIWRMPRGESVVAPPSHCPSCNTRLTLLDLFPWCRNWFCAGAAATAAPGLAGAISASSF